MGCVGWMDREARLQLGARVTKPNKIALGIGVAGSVCAAAAWMVTGVAGLLLAWTTAACAIAAAAYVANRPDWFGKRDGRLTWRSVPAAPYLVAFRFACATMRWWRPKDRPTLVAPGVWVGGRVQGALPAGVTRVVDLVAEFTEPAAARARAGYCSLPTLDGGVPPDRARCLALLTHLARDGDGAGVLVHCDAGRGRAPTFAAALLVARGIAPDVAAALRLVCARRPVSHPGAVDVAFLRAIEPGLHAIARARGADSPSRDGDARTTDACAAPL